ncbi:MAG TPA: hypothetical protein VE999_15915 [Gemmataceae bacterium]|nr:hypothetical protein [Gemmataceae bacterium]
MWYRVFGSNIEMPEPERILAFLETQNVSVSSEFATDTSGWYQADIRMDDVSLQIERYLADEQGIRAELNSWAAWLETHEDAPEHVPLMERMIQTTQLFTLQCSDTSANPDQICVALCRFLAQTTAGVYQIDGRGFFAADGALLVAE